jgi:hypothetical protein
MLPLMACDSNTDNTAQTTAPVAIKNVSTGLVIEYDMNFFLNKYDIRVSVDDNVVGTVKQGDKTLYELTLPEGSRRVVFAEVGDETNTTTASIDVTDGNYYYFFIKTKNSGIEIEKRDTLTLDEAYAIAGIADASNEDNNPENGEENNQPTGEDSPPPSDSDLPDGDESNTDVGVQSVNFSEDYAMRAVVVAFTNRFADDVFTGDGNNYDTSKFHSFADLSGYFLTIASKGVWSGKDENTWHVYHIQLQYNNNTIIDANLDVGFDGNNYIISNLTGKAPSYDDSNSNYSSMRDLENESDFPLFFIVPHELVNDDRSLPSNNSQSGPHDSSNQTSDDLQNSQVNSELEDWIYGQFSIWDGSHKELTKLIKKNLNDEKSYKHINTSYVAVFTEADKDAVNELLKSAGLTLTLEIGDVFIVTEFSAKNAFNATMKYAAYGFASYTNNTVTLLAIE